MVSYLMKNLEEGNGGLGDRKSIIVDRAVRSPRDEEARESIELGMSASNLFRA